MSRGGKIELRLANLLRLRPTTLVRPIVLSKTCNNAILNDTASNKLTDCLADPPARRRLS
jgi:hypothetical protein